MRKLAFTHPLACALMIASCASRPAPEPAPILVPPASAQPDPEPLEASEKDPPPYRKLVAKSERDYQSLVANEERTDRVQIAAPFLASGELFRARYMSKYGEDGALFHIGDIDGKTPQAIATPAELVAFGQKAGLVLEPETNRVSYIKVMLSLASLPYTDLVESLGDFRFYVPRDAPRTESERELREIDPDGFLNDQKKRAAVEDRFGPKIKPLQLQGSSPWHGTIHALAQKELHRIDVRLHQDGQVWVRVSILEKDVPVIRRRIPEFQP